MEKIKGRVLKFGNNINTTIMAPSEVWGHAEIIKHTMTAIRPNFPKEVKPGDVIVAGTNWGLGSSRNEATRVFIELGIKAIVAESIARLYYRNCLAYGLPAVICNGVTKLFKEGDQMQLDISKGEIKNITTGEKLMSEPMPEFILTLLEKGGILPLIVEKNKQTSK